MAKHLNQGAFKSLVETAMKSVEHILSNPTAGSEEQQAVTENCYVTLARLSLLHTQDAAHINQFLSALPLKGEDEAQEAHEFLFEQVLANNSVLMGPCKEVMQQAVIRIQTAHKENENLLTETGAELMNKVLAL